MTLLRRLMLFALVAMLPVGGMEIYNQYQLRETRKSEVRQQALNLAMLVDAQQEQIVQSVRQILVIMKNSPVIRSGELERCQEGLRRAKEDLPAYLDIQVTGLDGIIRCATNPTGIGVNIADRPHVREGLQTGGFAVGEYILTRPANIPALPFALSYEEPNGRPAGVVTGFLTLSWLSDYLQKRPLPQGAVVVVADRRGTVLARLPELPGIVGSKLPDRYAPMLHAGRPGIQNVIAVDGVPRVFGFVPAGQGSEGLFVAIGLDEQALLAPIDAAAARLAIMGIVVVTGGFTLIWWGARRYIERPVAALMEATSRWRQGDRATRVGIRSGMTEMVALGHAYDSMAESLEAEARVRQDAEAALRLSEARYRSIVNTAVDAFVVIDVAGVMQSVNPAAEHLFGYSADEMVGQNVRMLMPAPDRAQHDAYVGNYLKTGERRIIGIGREVFGQRKDGSTFPLELAVAEWEAGGKRHFTGIMRDISKRRDAEETMRRAKEETERASLAKSKFLASVSHDLRQPLQSTYLFMEMLRTQLKDRSVAELLARVQQGLDILRSLLDSLLDVSRLDAGGIHPIIQTVLLSDLLVEIEGIYGPVASAKGLHLRFSHCTKTVQTDPALICQMLRNLVDNAIKYTEHGEIRVECHVSEAYVWIEVCDTGIGIPDEHADRIWEEFHQVGNPERDREKGLGLGLAIVHRLSALLDHPVEVRSELGAGTIFRVRVPLAFDAINTDASDSPIHLSRVPEEAGRFAVVVDDEVIVLMGMEAMLRSWGYDVLAVPSADAAIEGLREGGRRPDIIVSDYRLREGKVGTNAVQVIRAAVGADIPALIITGETGGLVLQDAAEHRLPVLHKPVPASTLRQELERHLAAR
jgi:PAS domain S-box-containing protein